MKGLLLTTVMDMKDFQHPMNLKDALGLAVEKFREKKLELLILVDVAAFKQENAESADVYNTEVHFPRFLKNLKLSEFLELVLFKVEPVRAAYGVSQHGIIVTTEDRAKKDIVDRPR